MLYICVKFHNHISIGFQLTDQTGVHGRNGYVQCQRAITQEKGKSELGFIGSACCLISVKFPENILDGIRIMEQTGMMEALMEE